MVQTRKSRVGGRALDSEGEDKPAVEGSSGRRKVSAPLEASAFDPEQPIRFDEESDTQVAVKEPPTPVEVYRKNQVAVKKPSRKTAKRTFRGLLGTLATLYLLLVYFTACHGSSSSENPICKAFYAADDARNQVADYLHGYAKPHLDRVSAYVEPYAAQVRPHYSRASSFAKPYATQASQAYGKHVQPQLANAQKQAQAAASPYVAQAKAFHTKAVQPQLQYYQRIGRKLHADHLEPHISKGQAAVKPHLDYAQNVLAPAAHRYYDKVAMPYATNTYKASRDTYVKQVHPRLSSSASTILQFLRSHILPLFSRWNAVYVQPQIERVKEKVFEAKTKKAAAEAIVEAESKERGNQVEEKIDELDAFIETLREEESESSDEEEDEVDEPQPAATPTRTNIDTGSQSAAAASALKSAVSEKRRHLEAERDRYEAEPKIDRLAQTERLMLIQRLNSIRAAAVRDAPARFESRVNDVKHETSKLLGKLERYFDRVMDDEKIDVEEKVADADLITNKAVTRLAARAEEVQDELDAYSRAHMEKESNAVEQAFQAVHSLTVAAQSALGTGWAWLEDTSVDDWTRFHSLQKREDKVHGDYRSLVDGKVTDTQLDASNKPLDVVTGYKDEVDELVDNFESTLHKTRKAGVKRLRGTFGDSVRAVYESAKSAVVGESAAPTPSGVSESASSLYRQATDSASSLASVASSTASAAYKAAADAVGSQLPNVADASSRLSQAGNSASSMAGVASASASSYVSQVSRAASSAIPDGDKLSSSLHSATRSVASAAGVRPSPEGLAEHAQSLYDRASEAVAGSPAPLASSLSSSASSLARAASSIGGEAASSASSLASVVAGTAATTAGHLGSSASSIASRAAQSASSLASDASEAIAGTPAASGATASASSILSAVSDAASSSLHQATRVVIKAAGGEPSPEQPLEYVESVTREVSRKMATASVEAAIQAAKEAADRVRARLDL